MIIEITSHRNRVHESEIVDTIQNETGIDSITWLPLESEMFTSTAYDADRQVLYVRFRKSGDVYRYFEFPVERNEAFLNAESHGRFFLAHIRNKYPYERLARLQTA
jgi:hypothetical protein